LSASDIAIGAQDVYFEGNGAFTGEISCPMLKDCGCTYVIIVTPSGGMSSAKPMPSSTKIRAAIQTVCSRSSASANFSSSVTAARPST